MPLEYEQQFVVTTSECDAWARMMPGAALRRVQEISIEQCDMLGINELLWNHAKAVFLLSRMSYEVYRAPVKGEAVRIQTRAYGMQRAVYYRTTTLYSAQTGEKLCEADTRWVLVGMDNRRILRAWPEGIDMPFGEGIGDTHHEMKLPKVKQLAEVGRMKAAYTMCDTNRHMNNTRYADIVCDALPLETLAVGPVKKLLLHYHAEIPLGESFLLQSAPVENGYYFLATQEGHKNFEAFAAL